VNNAWETPFENIEGAQEYMRLLAEAVQEARQEVEADIGSQEDPRQRRLQALRIVSYKLEKLEQHMKVSQRILNDLRSLRRLLFEERRRSAPLSVDLVTKSDEVCEVRTLLVSARLATPANPASPPQNHVSCQPSRCELRNWEKCNAHSRHRKQPLGDRTPTHCRDPEPRYWNFCVAST
jgi:hypothetical protein